MYCVRPVGRFAYKHIPLMSRLLSLQPCCPHDEYIHSFISCSVRLNSILLLIIPGYFFIVVAPARRCPGSFFIFCRNPQLASRNVRDMYWTCLRKDYPLVILLYTILSDPVSGYVSTYLRYYSSLCVCHAVLSILSKGVYKNIQALSESPLEVCILTRRVGTLCPWFHCFWVLVECELYTTKTGGWCGYHVPGPTRLGKMSKPFVSSRLRFWKPCSGNSGDCHV